MEDLTHSKVTIASLFVKVVLQSLTGGLGIIDPIKLSVQLKDGNSISGDPAIMRHGGDQTKVR